MKDKLVGRIIIILAFIIICTSKVTFFFSERFLDSANYENRNMTTRPRLTMDTYETFSNDYTEYFNDNLQYRNNLISINSIIDYYIFSRSSNNDVVVGKDDWLFYSKIEDGDPISCYQGTNLYDNDQLERLADNCIAQRDYLLSEGKEFIIFIAPNKERIYSEYMPTRYGRPSDNYRALQVYKYLKENTDLRVVYPYEELMCAKNRLEENIWYKTDSHWNSIGGYVGAKALLSELGIDMPGIEQVKIKRVDTIAGDLANMLHLREQLTIDPDYEIEGYENHEIEQLESDFFGVCSYKAAGANPRRIYVVRDSFSTQMFPYIGSQFDNSYFRNYNTYSYEDFCEQDPDIVVLEVVERVVDRLADFSVQKKVEE